MRNVGCSINLKFDRPSKELVQKFAGVPVANIDDCMNRTAAADSSIFPLNKAPLLGTAFTVKVPQGDNLMFHKAMDLAQRGDAIVIDAGGSIDRAIFGEIMVTYCQKRGLVGVIVDGAVRDSDSLAEMDFPVYAKGVTPDGPYKNGPGEIGGVISFGGRVVHPGDIVVGDADSVLFIRPHDAEEVLKAAKAVMEKEAGQIEGILKECKFDRPWVDEKLKEIGCEYIQ